MIDERFSEGSSFLHSLDPRIKIAIVFPYACVIALSQKLPVAVLCLCVALVLLFSAKIKIGNVLTSLKVLFLFIVLLWIFLPLSMPGLQLYRYGPLTVTREGVAKALSITLKSIAIVLLIISLLATSTVFSLVHAMSHFRLPKKLLYLAFLSYRYIHVLYLEYARLRDAIRIRGFKPGTNVHTYKTFGYLIGMLLIRSYERSERIYRAMLCRGFQGRFYLLDHFKMRNADILFASGMTLILAGVVWLEWFSWIQ
jgi:cobalt/nickel transport system permease protein